MAAEERWERADSYRATLSHPVVGSGERVRAEKDAPACFDMVQLIIFQLMLPNTIIRCEYLSKWLGRVVNHNMPKAPSINDIYGYTRSP